MKTKMTMAQAFSRCAKNLKASALTASAIEKSKAEIALIKRMFGVTTIQSCLLSIIMSSKALRTTTEAIAELLEMNVIDLIGLHSDFEALANKGMITIEEESQYSAWNERYNPTYRMLVAVRNNRCIDTEDYTAYNENRFWSEASRMCTARSDDAIVYDEFRRRMLGLVDGCCNVDVCKKITGMQLREDELLFLVFAMIHIRKRDMQIYEYQVNRTFPRSVGQGLMREIHEEASGLVDRHLIKDVFDDDGFSCCMTDEAQKELLGIEPIKEEKKEDDKEDSVTWSKKEVQIREKELFYCADDAHQIEQLGDMLAEERYAQIVRRMDEEGMNPGLTCLLYGEPGTGKTETVKQIARRTGREIIQVDMSSLKSKWCGETEKNVNQVFVDYASKLNDSDLAPILLFNESDAIFSKRVRNLSNSNEQHSNSVQNILLENMETFRGILIATTNLTENFDKAFERRFLYKICFHKPNAEVRAKIWKSKLPELSDKDSLQLSSEFELTGAQIDNVVRKVLIDKILYGKSLDINKIVAICKEEKISEQKIAKV